MESKPIIREVSERYGISPLDIVGPRKNGVIAAARREVMVRLKALGMTAPQIGRIVKRDASTVLYHISPGMRDNSRRRSKTRWENLRASA